MNNSDIADHFSLLSKLLDIHGENSFKSKTYSIAAFQIEKLPDQLADMPPSEYSSLRGLGPSVAAKITELLETGHLQALEELIANIPEGVRDMLHLKGLGPKKINIVWNEMGIISIGELEYACHENRLTRYKGFGEKTQANVLASIQFYNQNKGHFLYAQIASLFESIQGYLEQLFGKDKVWSTGHFHRQMTTIHELEFIVNATIAMIKPKFQTAYPPEILEESNDSILYKLTNGLRLRLHAVTKNIPQHLFKTSSSLSFSEKFITDFFGDTFEKTSFSSELHIFEKAGIPFIPSFLRERPEIIETVKKDGLPGVITVSDIKGIIHNHSIWSDGLFTIEQMVNDLIKKNITYLVISDHSKSAAYANGLTEERIVQQHKEIDALNEKLAPFKIFKSIECDILNDGNLDYSHDILQTFDLVIASVHSNLYMNETKAMARLLKAIENPYTTILGHMTGRLLLSRNGYPINHKAIIDACAQHNVVIEINANPHRLDLDWSWIEYAMQQNVLLSINPDAHTIGGFNDIKYGVLAAQKGGLIPAYNLSSFTLKDFEAYISVRKNNIR